MSKFLTETAVAVNLDGENSKFCTVLLYTVIQPLKQTYYAYHIYTYMLYTYMYVCVQSDAYHKTYCFFQLLVLDNR